MAKSSQPKPLKCPPFPELTWDEFFWTCSDTLPEWAGFQNRGGAYCAESSAQPSDGRVELSVNTPDDEPTEPMPEQIAAYEFLKANGPAIAEAIVARIFQEYPSYRQDFSHWEEDEVNEILPPIEKPEDLKSLIGLGIVHFLPVAKDGVGYVGFEFGCHWDSEHGLGLMTHKNGVLDIGSAETAFGYPL